MSDEGERTRVGWWPTVVLWGTVIAVGALYLVSVEHHRQDARRDRVEAANMPAPSAGTAAAVELPVVEVEVTEVAVVEAPVGATPVARIPPVDAGPVKAPGASTSPATQPVDPKPGPISLPDTAPEPEVRSPSPDVSPVEARAIAKAVTESAPAVEAAAKAPTAVEPAPGQDKLQPSAMAERARILAEYEALRRAAQADLERRSGAGQRLPYAGWPRGQVPNYPRGYASPGAGQGYVPYQPRW